MEKERVSRIAREIVAMATIYQQGKYKVSVYPDEAEGKHKRRHVSVVVSNGDERGNVAIDNGEALNGNLSAKSINWCRETILTEENKSRITKMLEDDDYYRLDRPEEVAKHPIGIGGENRIAYSEDEYEWDDTLIDKIRFLGNYDFLITFANGKEKKVKLKEKMSRHPKVFRRLIENPELVKDVKIEPGGTGIYWDDLMGYACDWLYEIGE